MLGVNGGRRPVPLLSSATLRRRYSFRRSSLDRELEISSLITGSKVSFLRRSPAACSSAKGGALTTEKEELDRSKVKDNGDALGVRELK